jgi:photosystem II stability/assembly factor-like uncharacterized protein/pimeloyl-ACP methyl ester carboxylesterase
MQRIPFVIIVSLIALALLLSATGQSAADPAAGSGVAGAPAEIAASPVVTRTPLIFIPGIMGSRLFNQNFLGLEQEVWANALYLLPGADRYLDVLRLAADGVNPYSDEYAYRTVHLKSGAAGILTDISVLGFDIKPIYSPLIAHFEALGYREGVDFWIYPYDWRKTNRLAAAGLDQVVDQAIARTGQPQVTIVAHSMGGLVTRQYIADPQRAAKVKHIVTLGTPYLGTPKALYALAEGDCVTQLGPFCLPSAAETLRMLPNYPGFYELFASRAYFTVKGDGYVGMSSSPDPSGACPACLTYTQTYTTAVAPLLNTSIWPPSEQFHEVLDGQNDWHGIPVDIVVGTGQSTVVGMKAQPRFAWLEGETQTNYVPVEKPWGDGTVARYSASMENPASGVNLRGTATCVTFPDEHTGLTQDASVLAYVDQRLGLAAAAATPGSCSTPDTATAVQIIAAGASAIQAQDAAGRLAGQTSLSDVVKLEIPGSGYHRAGDIVSLALLDGQPYTITVIPTGVGMLDLALHRVGAAGPLTTTMHAGISGTAQSRVRFAGDPAHADVWQVDRFGDGSQVMGFAATHVYAPGLLADTQPPTATVQIARVAAAGHAPDRPVGRVTITLEVETPGAGPELSRIEYAFSNDRRPRVYTGPFVADSAVTPVLWAVATDRAGNQQSAPTVAYLGQDQPIKVPDDAPTIQDAINRVEAGGVIWVQAAGDPYQENLVITKSLTLVGGWNEDYSRMTPGGSKVDGQGRGRVFTIRLADPTQEVLIEGFTIVNGDATGQGGLARSEAGQSTEGLARSETGQSRETDQPVQLRARLAELAATGDFPGGQAGYQAALARLDRLAAWEREMAAPPMADRAQAPDVTTGCGGGVYSENASLTLIDNTIVSNMGNRQGAGAGGGVCVAQAPAASVRIRNNTFAHNIASLTGEGLGGGLYVTRADGAIIRGNTFSENVASAAGATGLGGGLAVEQAQAVVVQDNDFTGNIASTSPVMTMPAAGGGAYARQADGLAFVGNTFAENIASIYVGGLGGGLYVYNLGAAQIVDNEVTQNWGTVYASYAAAGGGIGLGALREVTITGNVVTDNIGGLYAASPQGQTDMGGGLFAVMLVDALISGNTISGNVAGLTARGQGGGLVVTMSRQGDSERLVFAGNLVAGNTASLGNNSGIAGGASFTAIDARIRGNRFEGNRTCASCRDASAGGLLVTGNLESTDISSRDVTLDSNVLTGNQANGTYTAYGGGLSIARTENFTLTNNVVAANVGRDVGGLSLGMDWPVTESALGKVLNNTCADNGAVGIGLAIWNATAAELTNNIVVSHTTGVSVSAHVTATLRYNLFFGNTADISGGGRYTHTHDVMAAPAFVDPAAGNFRIRLASAARDAGDPAGAPPAPDHDADGAKRPFGARVDIGAYEWRGAQIFMPMVGKMTAPYIGWAVGGSADGYGVILRTDDSGVTWKRQGQVGAIPDISTQGVSAIDAQNAWVVGGKVILRTRDGGASWEQQTLPAGLPANFELFQVKALDTNTAFVVGGSGVLLQTSNGGVTWSKMPTHPALPLVQYSDVDAVDATHVWAVGGVITDTNGTPDERGGLAVAFYDGVQWQPQLLTHTTGDCNVFIGVSAVDQEVAWAVGGLNCPPYKTVNGGTTWQAVGEPVAPGIYDTNRVVAVTRDLIWISHDFGFFRTTNGGADWEQTSGCSGGNYCYAISAAGTQYAWGADQAYFPPGNLYRWAGGDHWESQSVPVASNVAKLSFVGARR